MKRGPSTSLSLNLLVEVAPDGACLGHISSLPGLSFRGISAEELHRIARSKVADYARWLSQENLSDLNARASDVVRLVCSGRESEIEVIELERKEGARPWISGNPAALFQSDRSPLTDRTKILLIASNDCWRWPLSSSFLCLSPLAGRSTSRSAFTPATHARPGVIPRCAVAKRNMLGNTCWG